jgi:septal ring factor EnvC (AmiA/AmiB activator)
MVLIRNEVLIRFDRGGAYQGASVKYWDADRDRETEPKDLGTTDSTEFQEVLGELTIAQQAQLSYLQAQLRDRDGQVETLQQQLVQAEVTIAQLQTENQQLNEQIAHLTQKEANGFTGLYQAMLDPEQGGLIYQRIVQAALQDNAVSTSLSIFGFALTASRNVEALKAALAMLAQSLQATDAPFTANEKQTWNLLVAQYGLPDVTLT